MTKKEFLSGLRKRLSGLPMRERKERLVFYGEIIDDKIEEGLTEEAAVDEVGSIDEIAEQLLAELPASASRPSKPVSRWQIVLLAVGSPVWFPILISVYAVIWSVLIALWAVEIPLYIIGFIAKYLGIAILAATKFGARITKRCFHGMIGTFRG